MSRRQIDSKQLQQLLTNTDKKATQMNLGANLDELLEGMNPEQRQAIEHGDGPLGVFAGAGSGKTRVIVHRVAMLVRRGVPANRILAVTFSKNAADEMKQRGAVLGLADAEWRTWHSLALHILRDDHTVWATWTIDDTDRSKFLMKDVLGYKGLDWKSADLGKVLGYVGFCKSQLWKPNSKEARGHAEAIADNGREAGLLVEAYQRHTVALEEARLLTFDDFLCFAVDHLNTPGTAERWCARFDYVLQDEAQDANPAQLAIAQHFAQHHNYCVVGDPAQSIYKFRGSDPAFLLRFAKEWKGATVVNMNRNYRCAKSVIRLANEVIRPSVSRLPVDLIAESPEEGVVTITRPCTLEDEGAEVAAQIAAAHENGESYKGHAVLYRLNAQSRGIEEALLSRKIPYIVVGGVSFYERKEVKDLLAYLRLAANREVSDSFKRCVNAPFRFLGMQFVSKVQAFLPKRGAACDLETVKRAVGRAADMERIQARQQASVRDYLNLITRVSQGIEQGMKPDALLNMVLDVTRYAEWLAKDQGEESLESSHIANCKELVRVAARFATVAELLDFVDATIKESKRQQEESGADRVVLMSIHKSKGMEFRSVHFIGAVEQIIPHPRNEDMDEERRLAYVAITRAKRDLFITCPRVIATRRGIVGVEVSSLIANAVNAAGCTVEDGSESEPFPTPVDPDNVVPFVRRA